jgi:glycosyltransferase involved in cell wall biosynthesis
MTAPREPPALRIGYLSSRYPAISHAFILREVAELRRAGVYVETMSIRATDPADLLAEADKREHAATFAVLPTSAAKLLRAHFGALARSPRSYAATLAFALRTSPPGLRDRLWRLFHFAEAMLVRRHCRRLRIRHIHAQFADVATDVAMLVAHYEQLRAGSRDAFTWSLAVHGPVEFYNVERYGLPAKLVHARFASAISDYGRSQLMWFSEAERWEHLHVVHCGVDPSVYVPEPRVEDAAAGIRILSVGRLIRGKGLSILLEAMHALTAKGHAVRLTVVGAGPARADFEQLAQRLGLEEVVEFAGAVGQDEIRRHYASADVFCLPSFAEGIPVVLMEAMAMEIPVVSTTITGIPELIADGVHGLLVAPGRADALADALERLIAAPDLRAEMGRAGREKVSAEFDVRASARRLKEMFEQELAGSAAARETGGPHG